jgi:serine protease Do
MKKLFHAILIFSLILVLSSCTSAFNAVDQPSNYEIESIDEISIVNLKASNVVNDYPDLFNQISLDAIKGNVTVYTTSFDNFLMFSSNSQTYFGSGVIFYESDEYYYVLTNEHVAVKSESRSAVKYAIYDYLGNEHRGFLYEDSLSKDDDLAVLFFPKGIDQLKVMTFNEAVLSEDDKVIAIGQPLGQENTITFGSIIDFGPTQVTDKNDELITRSFDAIKHNARVNSGSSGGMLLDYNLNVIGINFASNQNDEVFVYSLSIPVSVIINYLEEFIIKDLLEGSE